MQASKYELQHRLVVTVWDNMVNYPKELKDISILPIILKSMEGVLKSHICAFMDLHRVLPNIQSDRITVTLLLFLT